MCDLLDAFWTHAPPAQHVGEERTHIGRPLRTTERDEQYRIERASHDVDRDYTGLVRSDRERSLWHRPLGQPARSLWPLASGLAPRLGQLLHRHRQRDGLSA